MKKIIVLLLLLESTYLYTQPIGTGHNYVYLGTGPIWSDSKSITFNTLKTDPSIRNKTVAALTSSLGYQLDMGIYLKYKRFLNLFFDFDFIQIKKGRGFIDSFNIKNKKKISTVEFLQINNVTSTNPNVLIADLMDLLEAPSWAPSFRLKLLLGYAWSKEDLVLTWDTGTSVSRTVWKGFAAGLRGVWDMTENLTLIIIDNVYPDRACTITSKNNILGIDAGRESVILVGNLLTAYLSYAITKHLSLTSALGWFTFKNVGKAQITLSETDAQLYENPKLCLLKGNQYFIFLYLSYSF